MILNAFCDQKLQFVKVSRNLNASFPNVFGLRYHTVLCLRSGTFVFTEILGGILIITGSFVTQILITTQTSHHGFVGDL